MPRHISASVSDFVYSDVLLRMLYQWYSPCQGDALESPPRSEPTGTLIVYSIAVCLSSLRPRQSALTEPCGSSGIWAAALEKVLKLCYTYPVT